MKVLFLYNVKAGRGRAEAIAEGVCRLFREQGHTISAQPIDFRTNPFEGREQLDLLIAAGGDGTMNYVTNCMKRKGLNIRLAVIPSG
ncbi:MAG: acylglycerol kinase family protein, partial [Alistipes sp.]